MNVLMIMNIEQQDKDHDQHQHQHQQAWDQVSTLNCQIKQKAGSLNMSIPHGYYWVKEVIPWSCLPIPNASAAVDELNLWDSNTDLQVYWNGKSIKRVLAVRCAVFYHLLLRNAWVVRGLEGGILEQGWSHSRSTTTIFWLYDLGRGQRFYDQGSKTCGIERDWL